MLNFVSVNIKCPICGKSLMDKKHLVDNKPSVFVKIKFDGQEGDLRLSSIYGSYNLESSVEIPQDTVVRFFCPHCSAELKSDRKCDLCGAPMIPFNLIEGGGVHICSRRGCKGHSIEFDDLELALRHFYNKFAYGHLTTAEKPEQKPPLPKELSEEASDKEIIRTGTYLQSYCPYCHKSLIENDVIKLKIKNKDGEVGYLYLSPYLNVFTHKSTIRLPERKQVADISCPHCGHSLIEKEKKCEMCGSEVARISVSAMTKLIDFYICTRKGCPWHGLSDEDVKSILLEDSEEW